MNSYETSSLIDDAARILASPLPRRQALKALCNLLTGAFLAGFVSRQADSETATCKPACARGQTCCPGTNGKPFCVSAGQTCCGNTFCVSNESCCTGTNGQQFPSGPGNVCCGNYSYGPTQQCCRTGSQPFTCDHTATCCGNTSCPKGETCCGKSVCCGQNYACINGRCEPSKS